MQLLVNIDVPDLERAVAFYTGAFDLRVGRRLGPDVVELLGGSSPIYLLRRAAGTPPGPVLADSRRTYERHWTPVHLDIEVDDVDRAAARAGGAGARLEAPVSTQAWGRLARMADPFGHGLCLIEFLGRGYDEPGE